MRETPELLAKIRAEELEEADRQADERADDLAFIDRVCSGFQKQYELYAQNEVRRNRELTELLASLRSETQELQQSLEKYGEEIEWRR